MDEYGFESRLRHLEHILVGQQSHQLTKTTSDSIYKRLDAIQKELNSVYKNNKPVKEFVAKYDGHAKLLNPNSSTYNLERETLAPDVKLELLLAAQEDLEKFAQEVKQVKDLEYVVNGTDFDVIETLGPKLAPLEVTHADQVKELNDLTRQISQFMERYNGTINTLSEIFIQWDHILTNLETHITALEHEKKATH
ncbi:Dynactin subunit 3 [Choanephora cucurbitarum]|uniref:Dynactin subunit 3 n=1 Tax=Choanephora cucurbitarum TaxID=101091 RepID=A0A1C7NHX0_9FUNG|nr:Dynactin subunit 3 [Choanephora cucurbitarum]